MRATDLRVRQRSSSCGAKMVNCAVQEMGRLHCSRRAEDMEAHPVSQWMKSPHRDGHDCIEPVRDLHGDG